MEKPQIVIDDSVTISYKALRRSIGYIGMALPFVILLYSLMVDKSQIIEPSISDYYYTSSRNLFVGALCAVALFLFCYGSKDSIDNRLTNLAGILLLLTAMFPTVPENACYATVPNADLIGKVHLISAASFFLICSIISVFIFTRKQDDGTRSQESNRRKGNRDKTYVICGIVMFLALVLSGIFVNSEFAKGTPLVWLCETVMLVAFGISWLTKGHVLFGEQ